MQVKPFQSSRPVSIQHSQHQVPQPSLKARRLVQCLAGIGVTAGLVASVVPAPRAIAIPSPLPRVEDFKPTKKDYSTCTAKLLNVKLSVEEATSACARALVPSDLSRCVEDVAREGNSAPDALSACRQVRRPKEMAKCVVQIRREVKDSAAADVLDNCRRSLLPDRFADCVVGTSRRANYPPAQAINTCIDGGYFPREVDPTFISYPLVQPPEPTVESPVQDQPAPTTPATPAPTTPTPPSGPTQTLPQRY